MNFGTFLLMQSPSARSSQEIFARGVEMAWSPDGSIVAYHEFTEGDPIFIADRDAGNPRRLHRRS